MNENSNSKQKDKRSGFLLILGEYKELIAIIVFFVGGILWLYGFFATKREIKELKCLLNTNVSIIHNQMMNKFLLEELTENRLKQESIRNKKNLTPQDFEDLVNQENKANLLQKSIDDAIKDHKNAMEMLKKGRCSDV